MVRGGCIERKLAAGGSSGGINKAAMRVVEHVECVAGCKEEGDRPRRGIAEFQFFEKPPN